MSVFAPIADSNVFSLSTSSQRFALSTDPTGPRAIAVRRLDTGVPIVYMKFGDDTVEASTSDSMIALIGSTLSENYGVPYGATHVAFVVQSSSVNMNVTEGVLI